MQELIKNLEEACQKYQQPLKEEEIFQKFISNHYDQWQNAKTTIETVCGAQVPSGELTFQCFTCAPDPHHMYCYHCFDMSLHKNHKCIIKHNIGGCCDCGDVSVIKQEGFCNRHKGFGKINSQEELSKISEELQNQIRNFVKAICTIYFKLMKQIKAEYNLYDNLVVQYYHHSEKWGIQPIKNVIDEEINIDVYYRNFQMALYLHSMLFRTIIWLTKSRLSYILLITKILAEKLTSESHQSIIEDLFEYQVIVETQGPYEALKLESIIFSFHADQNFKDFLRQIYLRKYKYFWLVTQHKNCELEKEITELLNKLKTIRDRQIVQQYANYMIEISKKLSEYIKASRGLPNKKTKLQLSEIHEQHTQYVSEHFQIDFLNDNNLKNIFEMNTEIQNILHNNKSVCTINQIFLPGIFKLRFEYVFFDTIVFQKLQTNLGEYYQQFINTKANNQLLNKLQVKDFFLTAYIQSFSNVKPIELDIDEEDLTIEQHDVFDAAYFMIQQGLAIKTIQIGVNQIIQSKFNKGYLGDNIVKYLLRQCYGIIKNNRNKFTNIDQELDKAYQKFIIGSDLKLLFDKQSKIYLLLIKSGTFVDKILIFILCYVYNQLQFQQHKQFRQYLLELFEEDFDSLQQEFNQILSRCIQTFVSIQFGQNGLLEEVYLGLRDQKEQSILESFDTAFLRIYQFLFGNEGYQHFQQIILGKHLPNIAAVHKLQSAMQLRLISSEIDMYNVCGHMFADLPSDLKFSLAKILQNFYNLSVYLDYTDIEAKLISMGIQVSKNTSNHILQICELDQSVKKLKLKQEFRPIFDPAIFNINTILNNQIVEKLVEKKKEEGYIFMGDGIKWDVEQFSTEKYRVMLHHFLKNYSDRALILENLQILNHNGHFSIQTYQLLYIQIIAANYFRKAELQDSANLYIEQLTKIYLTYTRNDDIQRLKSLIHEIELKTIKIDIEQREEKPTSTLKVTNAQNKYKAKFQTLQNSSGLQAMLDNSNLDEKISVQQCSSCKIDLFSSEANAVILLSRKPKSLNFNLPELGIENQIRHIGLTNCRHFYHNSCLVDQFEINSKHVDQNLPRWVKLGCPVCKQASNFMLPLAKDITDKEVKDFNSSLFLFLLESGIEIKDTNENVKNDVPIIYQLYYQLIFDLLTQLYSNPQEYKRNEKYVIFQQLIKLLLGTAKMNEQYEKPIFYDMSSIYKLLSLIEQQIVQQRNYEQFQQESLKWLNALGCHDNEIKTLLYFSLAIPDDLQQQQQQLQNIKNDETIQFYSTLSQWIYETMITKLGVTFQEFYYRHFPLMCSKCGFFNINQKLSKDVLVCLLCSQAFCQFNCVKQPIGNLNFHAKTEHSGHSLYISLTTGNIIIVSFPISINKYKCLYYNKLGQKINIEDSHTQWSDFVLDKQKVKEISQIILNNSYQSIVRNLEVRQNQLDLNGTY